MRDVLILGGYGNFGKRISAALVRHNVPVIVAGRDPAKAQALVTKIQADLPGSSITPATFDAERELEAYLQAVKPAVVINTCGPFQNKNYNIAEACIRHKTHYIDLADGRDFVTGISRLDLSAKEAGICVISGASTVPGLSSAVLERYKDEFSEIGELIFGISPGQKAERGLATTAGILTYTGKRLNLVPGDSRPRYGWQGLYRQAYPGLGSRWMANCDIPDLDLLPAHYKIQKIRFSAGVENLFLHFGLWGLSWLVRFGAPLNLPDHAARMLRLSNRFDRFGSDAGGMHVIIKGKGHDHQPHVRRWFIVARKGDGPQIPCVPAILLAKRLAESDFISPGAMPCLGLVSLQDYLAELSRFPIQVHIG